MRHQWRDLVNREDKKVRQCKGCRTIWTAVKVGRYWDHNYTNTKGEKRRKAGECGNQLELKLY